jgi:hypothetical protein
MKTEHPPKVIDETSLNESTTSAVFRADENGHLFLDIQANHGTGVQNLVGTLYLRHRADPDDDMGRVDGYDFPFQPAGVKYRHQDSYEGAAAGEYDIEFVRASGQGDLVASARTPKGMR